VEIMRRIRARRAIAKVLLANPNGMTAHEIITKLDPKITLHSIVDARHVSNLLRGAKGVHKEPKGGKINNTHAQQSWKIDHTTSYKVALYSVSDAQALEKWVA
jgi:hypothetical protein